MPVSVTFDEFLPYFQCYYLRRYRVLFFEYQIPKTFIYGAVFNGQSAGEMRGYCASRDNAVDYISSPDNIRRCRGKIANSDRIFIHSFGTRGKCRPHFIRLGGTCFRNIFINIPHTRRNDCLSKSISSRRSEKFVNST